jgi:hypothetical protein
VRYLRQTTGLTITVLECRLSRMEESFKRILGERARLLCEVTHLKNQFEVSKVDSSLRIQSFSHYGAFFKEMTCNHLCAIGRFGFQLQLFYNVLSVKMRPLSCTKLLIGKVLQFLC